MFSKGPLAGSCTVSVPSMRCGSKRRCTRIFAVAVDAARGHIGARILERAHVQPPRSDSVAGSAGERAPSRTSSIANRLTSMCGMDSASPAALGMRRALHVEVRDLETVDGDAPLEQRERRPGERDALGGEPYALLVGELEPTKREVGREGAAQAGELHHAAGDAAR